MLSRQKNSSPIIHSSSYVSLATLRDCRKRTRFGIPGKAGQSLIGKTGAEHGPGLRPVAQYAAHHVGLTFARTQERDTRNLKSNFNRGINFKRAFRPKQQSALAHVDGLTDGPVFLSRQAKAQRKAERDPRCAINLCFGFTRFRQLTPFDAICVLRPALLPGRLIYLALERERWLRPSFRTTGWIGESLRPVGSAVKFAKHH